jgi:hypothetical protein
MPKRLKSPSLRTALVVVLTSAAFPRAGVPPDQLTEDITSELIRDLRKELGTHRPTPGRSRAIA